MDRKLTKRHVLLSLMVVVGASATTMAACSVEETPTDENAVQIAEKAPPPISGGTMIVTSKGTAVLADSDRDVVWLVDPASRFVRQVALQEDDEPGRVIEDGQGLLHVALRRAGAIATIDPSSAKIVDRSEVCDAPRGLAYDSSGDVIHVACSTGELVTVPAAGGAAVRTLHLDRDLRDVILSEGKLVVSIFRSAELLVVDPNGAVVNRTLPPLIDGGIDIGMDPDPGIDTGFPTFSPTVAWRTVPLSGGGFVMAHQQAARHPVVISRPNGYGGGGGPGGDCDGGIVRPTITIFDKDGNPRTEPSPLIPGATLPVDIAAGGDKLAMVAAGSNTVIVTSTSDLEAESGKHGNCSTFHSTHILPAQPVAVAFWQSKIIVQTRQPAALYFLDDISTPIPLPGESVADSGHDLFHLAASPSAGIACASCHPEGRDDAHTWTFDLIGARRTQTVSGDVLHTAPLHWDGDMSGLDEIMGEVFVNRMGGTPQGPRHIRAFSSWVGELPAFQPKPKNINAAAVARGEQIFNDPTVGCATCHSGGSLTNNESVDVGTGKAFQVPTLLGIANRAPFMHDGCATTLKDRFGVCGGGDLHGHTSHLSDGDLDDMVAYLETL